MKTIGKDLKYCEFFSKDAGYTVYSVFGEDANCDLVTDSHSTFLGNVEGTFNDVLEYAANEMKGFYTCGNGGYIRPKSTVTLNYCINNQISNLIVGSHILSDKDKLLNEKICSAIDFIIDNIDLMTNESIKNQLLGIKNKLYGGN